MLTVRILKATCFIMIVVLPDRKNEIIVFFNFLSDYVKNQISSIFFKQILLSI